MGINWLTRTKKDLQGYFQNKPQFSFKFISRSHHTSKLFPLCNNTYIFMVECGHQLVNPY